MKRFFTIWFIAVVLFASCNKDETESTPTNKLSVSPSLDIVFTQIGGMDEAKEITVTTDAKSWDVTSSEDWCELIVSKKDAKFTVVARTNTISSPRIPAIITISAGNAEPIKINATQEAGEDVPTLSLNLAGNMISFISDAASTENITVTTNQASWDAVVREDGAWCVVRKSTDYFVVSALANTNTSARSTTITVSAGEATPIVINVTQQAKPGPATIQYVDIVAGKFKMGSSDTYTYSQNTDKPQITVTLTKGFKMSKYEITNSQYADFLNEISVGADGAVDGVLYIKANELGVQYANGAWTAATGRANCPMVFVSQQGALAFAQNQGGTLPTEAQWEYACKAGTDQTFFFGEGTYGSMYSLCRQYGWVKMYGDDFQPDKPQIVGTKDANPWGLYDMYGNVNELCLDRGWGGDNYGTEDKTDPVVTTETTGNDGGYMIRGGSWDQDPEWGCNSTRRDAVGRSQDIFYMSAKIGFRIVKINQ